LKVLSPIEKNKSKLILSRFYAFLRDEVVQGNPYLDQDDQKKLQDHYPVILNLKRYSPEMAAMIYSSRRSHAVGAILDTESPYVFDAGCGYGSESFLFAGLGAKVLAVDSSHNSIFVAKKRRPLYEEFFGKPLDITFEVADLETYTPVMNSFSLTWIASVLAAIRDQNSLLQKIYTATRPRGEIMITDMNLLNPLFLVKEWYRRQQAKKISPEFGGDSNFWEMVKRQRRTGARYFRGNDGLVFDDVEFFSALTLSRLLSDTGFMPRSVFYSGFVPPHLWQLGFAFLENVFSGLPLLRWFGYFYLVAGIKQ
jgi:SAM-dependent methyltransferase